MSQDVTITLSTSGSGHTSSTTYTATANLGSITPGTATNAELVAGKTFTLDSDSATSITITPSNGACSGSVPATHTWSVAASPTPTPSTSVSVVTPTPTATITPTPSTSPPEGGPTWYSFQASDVNGDPGSVCDMATTTTYYNLTASYATGLMKLYNSQNLADPNTDTGYIKSGSKYISIGAGTLASFQPECSAITETLQVFYRSAPSAGTEAAGDLCSSSYNVTTPTWAYLPTPFNEATIQAGNKTIYSATGSSGPSSHTKLSSTIIGSGTQTRYWAISTTSGGTTDDGTSWRTIQVTNTDINSYASSGANLDCSDPGGEGPIP